MDKFDYKIFYKRHLPHYQPKDGYIFITYRFTFSLPREIIKKLAAQKQMFEKETQGTSMKEKKIAQLSYFEKMFCLEDDFLDKYYNSPC